MHYDVPRLSLILVLSLAAATLGCERSSTERRATQAISASESPETAPLDVAQPVRAPIDATAVQLVPTEVDLGDITIRTKASRMFKLINALDRPVRITAVLSSCGCEITSLRTGTVLEPLQTIEREVWITATLTQQPITDTLTIELENAAAPLVLQVNANAVAAVTTEPSIYDQQSNPTGHIKFTSADSKPFRILAMKPAVITEFPIAESSVIQFDIPWERLLAAIGPRGRGAWNNQLLTFTTSHSECPEVAVMVKQNEREADSAEPPS